MHNFFCKLAERVEDFYELWSPLRTNTNCKR